MKAQIFVPMYQISILGFLHAFQMACDSKYIHEGALCGCSRTLGGSGHLQN